MAGLPEIEILEIDPARRDDGVILLTVGRNTRSINRTSDMEAVIAIDRAGEIAWHRRFGFALMDCRLSLQETLLVMGTDGRAAEIGFDGRLLRQWYCAPRFPDGLEGIPLATEKIHHTICEIGTDRYLTLSIEQRPLPDPDADWTHFIADTVVVFAGDGTITTELRLADVLDCSRESHGDALPYWPSQGWPKTRDRTHGNCAIADPRDGCVLLSLRHQDCVAKLSLEGELAWILGDPGGWQGTCRDRLLSVEGGRPFYHQHDLSFTAGGDLMLFDNGTAGAVPPAPEQPIGERESFGLAYAIDERGMTACETWRYGGPDLPYSHYVSGVCETPAGNRFLACTGLCHTPEGARVEFPPQGIGSIVLKEVAPGNEVVFHARIRDARAAPGRGWNGFRPEYLPPEFARRLR